MSDTQHIHPHAIPQAGYNPIALAATLACEELSVSVRLPSFPAPAAGGGA